MKEKERFDAQKLDDMRAALLRIETIIDGLDHDEFLADITAQEAVAFRIMALGDAAGRVSRRTQDANLNINWRRIASFRNNPAHEYYDFKPENLWEFLQDVLPNLEGKLRKVGPAPESSGWTPRGYGTHVDRARSSAEKGRSRAHEGLINAGAVRGSRTAMCDTCGCNDKKKEP